MEKHYYQLIIFYYVSLFKSFTKAAHHLNYSKGYVSKQVHELESKIGVILLHRNTRVIQLTQAGEAIFEHAALIVREYLNTENTIASLQNKAEGLLRLTAPPTYANCILASNLPHFFKDYPQIRVEINLTGQLVNLVDQKIDVAIRLTHEPPLDRVAKKIGVYQEIICASPQYLKKKGVPSHPKELLNHNCLIYSYNQRQSHWPFLIDSAMIPVVINPKLEVNSSSILLESALSGLGIARLPNYMVNQAIKRHQLEEILSNFYPPPTPIYAIYIQSRIIPKKIRVFLKFLQEIHEKML
ncbi:LysR family transcriptional regulator [Legionella cincinnatiensis]|uniref:LysR family transcriptional regulator n=1 Tax=Legionella cincinnatiensis TaxID=28085 RepID=A0A378IL37_9GAMM|nr:LysR family transcriptional regulator [Legionella cincinnatiensis]KTC83407.1 LysR family transcriptional regulator [Legionella cincinnatiensis]STX35492.1 LysR family transcriptional regulator [Legionella cincinnatiensis]